MTPAVIFDFGGVLSVPDDEAAWESHLDTVVAELGFECGAAMWSYLYRGEAWQLSKTGRITEDEFWQRLLAPYGLATAEGRREWVQRLFEPFGGVDPRMRELLGRLKGRYKLAL